MDLKNKRDDNPHGVKETRSKKIVIGLSGGVNSMVAACLLKLQKFELVAVTVTFDWQDYGDSIDQLLSCHVNSSRLDQIREFCHQLGIPHIVLNATDEFREAVTESWVGSRLTGTNLNACWNCHDLRIKLIFDKLSPLDADLLATGHMAKLFKSDLSGLVSVHTSCDVLYDDSPHLARLPNAILDKMILPLSDLQHKEILKLALNFGISSSMKKIEPHSCFPETFHYENFFKKQIPKVLNSAGEIIGPQKTSLGDHEGILNFSYFQPVKTSSGQLDSFRVIRYSFHENKIEVATSEYFKRKNFLLIKCTFRDESLCLNPVRGFLKINQKEIGEGWIYPKNLNAVWIELDEFTQITEGEIITIQKKKGKNAKVILTGEVKFLVDKSIVDEGNKSVKVDYSRDY